MKAALVHLDASADTERVVDSIRATEADTATELADLEADEGLTRYALDLLDKARNDAYEAALEALREDTAQWWQGVLSGEVDQRIEDEEPYTVDAAALRRFLEEEVLSWFDTRRKELANRPLIREQAFGDALSVQLAEALALSSLHSATLVIAKLDRLSPFSPWSAKSRRPLCRGRHAGGE